MRKSDIFKIALAWGLVFSLGVCCVQAESQRRLSEKMVRLHIVANSDSEADQDVKLKVRDEVLKCGVGRYPDKYQLDKVKAAADGCLEKYGFSEKTEVSFGKSYFDTRDYGEFSLPAGYYNAVRVVIGEGKGHNWWCVIYPSLCSGLAEVRDKEVFSDEEIDFIMKNGKKYRIKFKLQEIISAFAREIL